MLFVTLAPLFFACTSEPSAPPVIWEGVEIDIGSGIVETHKADRFSIRYPTLSNEAVMRGAYGAVHEQLVAAGWKELAREPGFGAFRLPDGRGVSGSGFVMADQGFVALSVRQNSGLEAPFDTLDLDLSLAVANGDQVEYFARSPGDAPAITAEWTRALGTLGWVEEKRGSTTNEHGLKLTRVSFKQPASERTAWLKVRSGSTNRRVEVGILH